MKQHHCLTGMAALLLLGGCREQSVCGDCLDNTGVHVDFPDPPVDGEHSGAVLFSGWRDYWCRTDVLCTGSSSVYLGDVRWRADQFGVLFPDLSQFCKKRELAAFASGRAPTILGTAAGLNFPSPETDWFAAPAQVNVALWEIDPAAWASHDRDVLTAKAVFEDVGSGITLNFWWSPSPHVDMDAFNDSYYRCESADGNPANGDASRARQLSSGYDPNMINVYYVSSVRPPGHAWTCADVNNPTGAWDVIFIARDHLVNGLAHELGHALGLNRTATLPGGTEVPTGDIDELDMERVFGEGNLMNYGSPYPPSLTVGQIYRMHFDVRSWLNKNRAAVANGYPRECQDNPVSGGDCPPLALSPPEGWP